MKNNKDNLLTVVTKSRAIAVVAMVLIVNAVVAFLNPFAKTSLAELPKDHSWISWTMADYVAQPKTPDLVYIGSSLVLHPLTMLDAHHLNKTVDYTDHHRSLYTEDRLAEKLGVKPTCYNFAMPGGMISDDWIILESLIRGNKKPKVVVLGLCARDFMDCKVRCPGATPSFKYLSKVIDLQPVLDLALPNLTDRTDFVIGKIAYLWEAKPAVQALLSERVKALLGRTAETSQTSNFTAKQLDELLTADMSAELERGMMVEEPDKERAFSDNTLEYMQRYKHKHEKLFDVEKQFFEKLLVTAKANDVRVVVINMPLTSLNVRLMPSGTYDEYLAIVQGLTKKYGFVFENLNDDSRFPSSVFYDTVHMNSVGGRRLVDALVQVLSDDKLCAEALVSPNVDGIASGGAQQL